MCASNLTISLFALGLVTSSVLAAPLIHSDEGKAAVSTKETEGAQDSDLRALMDLVGTEADQDHATVHKEEMTHIETVNGVKHQSKQIEEKVLDSNTGEVTAEIKQEVTDNGHGRPLVETELDIPSKGIHRDVIQEVESDQSATEDAEEDDFVGNELSPRDMAEFLLSSQQMDVFYSTPHALVNQGKLSPAEAEDYAREVSLEYEQLENLYTPSQIIPNLRSFGSIPAYDIPSPQIDRLLEEPEVDYLPFLRQQQQQELSPVGYFQDDLELNDLPSQVDLDTYDFLNALLEEAFENGNEEAQGYVQMLYDRVSEDSNRDVMGQSRDMLGDSGSSTPLASQKLNSMVPNEVKNEYTMEKKDQETTEEKQEEKQENETPQKDQEQEKEQENEKTEENEKEQENEGKEAQIQKVEHQETEETSQTEDAKEA